MRAAMPQACLRRQRGRSASSRTFNRSFRRNVCRVMASKSRKAGSGWISEHAPLTGAIRARPSWRERAAKGRWCCGLRVWAMTNACRPRRKERRSPTKKWRSCGGGSIRERTGRRVPMPIRLPAVTGRFNPSGTLSRRRFNMRTSSATGSMPSSCESSKRKGSLRRRKQIVGRWFAACIWISSACPPLPKRCTDG